MSAVLLDTTVVSFLINKDVAKLYPYLSHLQNNRMMLSFQSVAELWKGVIKVGWGEKRRTDLASFIDKWFTIIPYDEQVIHAWANLSAESERQGYRLECGDAWIAATAVIYDLPLLTHDKDFVRVGILGLNVICYAT
ncbi:MAG: PIN domain-containing protein [Candidatus Hatepunaea meridiana]|nr:PIN domain-containing protein [Candidatus Hatepunaea meridiana]